MSIDLSRLRNIGIAAHIDAGKTTTTERVLYYAGRTHRPGEVDEGTTVTDFDEQEQQRGITIFSAAVRCEWKDHVINLIDTPGHVDFTAEVERSLRVLDGMVAVFDAKEGVEAQSETVWRQANRYRVPRICFINKMDKAGADFAGSVASIEKRLGARAAVMQIPIGQEQQFEGLIDLLEMKAYRFDEESRGMRIRQAEIPQDMLDEARAQRAVLIERICETDDALTERFLGEQALDVGDLKAALRRATIANQLRPVLCGSALKYIGVQRMLDAVCDYLPSPLELPPVKGHDPDDPDKDIPLPPDPDEPMAALVFKVLSEKPVDLYFVRVYSGKLTSNSRVLNPRTKQKENVTRVMRMYAKKREALDVGEAGDIVAVIGLREVITGDTLCTPKRPVLLESIEFPETVVAQSIEPATSRDRDRLMDALRAMSKQDPTFKFRTDEETGQTLIMGMGELHLEVLAKRMVDDMNVNLRIGKPRVSYRETVSAAAEGEASFDREFGGRRHVAHVRVRIEPVESDEESKRFRVEMPTDAIDEVYLSAIETGVYDAATSGALLGYPMIHWRAVLVDARQHDTDSSDVAFETAARLAFNQAVQNGSPILLEPIMDVQIRTPEEYFGSINADLNMRRATIAATDMRGEYRLITAHVPLAEVFGYTTQLRSLSQGRASASMEPLQYAPVPANIAASMI